MKNKFKKNIILIYIKKNTWKIKILLIKWLQLSNSNFEFNI